MKTLLVLTLALAGLLLPVAQATSHDRPVVTTPLAPSTLPSPEEAVDDAPGLTGSALLALVVLGVIVIALVVIASRTKRRLP